MVHPKITHTNRQRKKPKNKGYIDIEGNEQAAAEREVLKEDLDLRFPNKSAKSIYN